jgi:hypothetical protein
MRPRAVGQRKHRDRREREAIREELLDGLVRSKLVARPGALLDTREVGEPVAAFLAVLDRYVAFADEPGAGGRQLDGKIAVPELGVQIEYVLPGRRVLRHMARVSRMDAQGAPGAQGAPVDQGVKGAEGDQGAAPAPPAHL